MTAAKKHIPRLNDPFYDDLIFKQKPVKHPLGDEGEGSGELYNNVMPLAEGLAALNDKNYSPAAAAAKARVAELSHAAAQLFDTGLAPTPFGTSSPDVTPSSTEKYVRNPNRAPETTTNHQYREVILEANSHHAYYTRGLINQKRVEFLVDTGASSVSIPFPIAEILGLKPTGRSQQAQTANGYVTIYETRIESLMIGDIQLSGIKASINMGDRSDQILLGMTALKELEMVHKEGRLILRQYLD